MFKYAHNLCIHMGWKEFFKFTWLKLVIFLLLLIVIPIVSIGFMWANCPLTAPNLSGIERTISLSCNIPGLLIWVLWPTAVVSWIQPNIPGIFTLTLQLVYTYSLSSVIVLIINKIRKS